MSLDILSDHKTAAMTPAIALAFKIKMNGEHRRK